MSRPALLALFAAALVLAGCTAPAATPAGLLPETATARHPPTATPAGPKSTAPPAHLAGAATSTPSPTRTRTPAAAPATATSTATATATSTPPAPLPPVSVAQAGEPLAFSLGWRLDANGHLTASAISQAEGEPRLFLSSLGRTVYALDAGGRARWQARLPGPVYCLEALPGDELAVGDDAGTVSLLDDRGRRLWQHDLGSRVTAVAAGPDGELLAGGWDERLTCLALEPAGERVSWQVDLPGAVLDITVAGELVVVATLDGHLLAFDLSGQPAWQLSPGTAATRLGTVGTAGSRMVLAGVQDGRLLAIGRGGDGGSAGQPEIAWQRMLGDGDAGSPVWDMVRGADGSVQIAAGTGGSAPLLALLDVSGTVLWRVAVAAAVGAVAALDLDGDGQDEILAGLASGEVIALDLQGRTRGAVHAGLGVWDLVELEGEGPGAALALADVVGWELGAGAGPGGGPWLSPPALVPLPTREGGIPPAAEAPTREPGRATLAFLGDVALGRSVEALLERYGAAYPWGGLAGVLDEADLAVVNLEGGLTTAGQPIAKPYVIRAHPLWAAVLPAGGVDLVTLANNHALDYGPAGLDDTLHALGEWGVGSVGAGSSVAEAHRPALVTLNGVRVALLGYAAARWIDSEDIPATDRLAFAEPGAVAADVQAAAATADLVVVLLHAGTEYAGKPTADQVAVAHAAVDAGAGLVVGHHPHVTQTVERYRDGLIVYSLGDALFDIPRQAAMRGDLLRVQIDQDGLARAELWPFWIEDSVRPRFLDDGTGQPAVRQVYP